MVGYLGYKMLTKNDTFTFVVRDQGPYLQNYVCFVTFEKAK